MRLYCSARRLPKRSVFLFPIPLTVLIVSGCISSRAAMSANSSLRPIVVRIPTLCENVKSGSFLLLLCRYRLPGW